MKSSLLTTILLLSMLLHACLRPNRNIHETPLARVHEKFLYPSDIHGIITRPLNHDDSLRILNSYVEKWVRKELMLSKAELNLSPAEMQEIQKQLDETRTSLIIYHYQQQLLKQKLDTVVTDEQVQEYYEQNTPNFLLDRPIVKALYIRLPLGVPNLDKLRQWYRSNLDTDMNELESYCFQYANKFDYFNEDWINLDQITRQLPSEISNIEQFLRYNNSMEMQDSLFHYFVSIREYQLTGTPAPVSYVAANIKNIIINKRKIEFIKQLENNIFNDAMNGNEFDIYD